MSDPNVAQAALLIAALSEQIREMTPKLLVTERRADSRNAAQARAMHHMAAERRRESGQAQFLIARLRRRFPDAGIEEPNLAVNKPPLADQVTATAS